MQKSFAPAARTVASAGTAGTAAQHQQKTRRPPQTRRDAHQAASTGASNISSAHSSPRERSARDHSERGQRGQPRKPALIHQGTGSAQLGGVRSPRSPKAGSNHTTNAIPIRKRTSVESVQSAVPHGIHGAASQDSALQPHYASPRVRTSRSHDKNIIDSHHHAGLRPHSPKQTGTSPTTSPSPRHEIQSPRQHHHQVRNLSSPRSGTRKQATGTIHNSLSSPAKKVRKQEIHTTAAPITTKTVEELQQEKQTQAVALACLEAQRVGSSDHAMFCSGSSGGPEESCFGNTGNFTLNKSDYEKFLHFTAELYTMLFRYKESFRGLKVAQTRAKTKPAKPKNAFTNIYTTTKSLQDFTGAAAGILVGAGVASGSNYMDPDAMIQFSPRPVINSPPKLLSPRPVINLSGNSRSPSRNPSKDGKLSRNPSKNRPAEISEIFTLAKQKDLEKQQQQKQQQNSLPSQTAEITNLPPAVPKLKVTPRFYLPQGEIQFAMPAQSVLTPLPQFRTLLQMQSEEKYKSPGSLQSSPRNPFALNPVVIEKTEKDKQQEDLQKFGLILPTACGAALIGKGNLFEYYNSRVQTTAPLIGSNTYAFNNVNSTSIGTFGTYGKSLAAPPSAMSSQKTTTAASPVSYDVSQNMIRSPMSVQSLQSSSMQSNSMHYDDAVGIVLQKQQNNSSIGTAQKGQVLDPDSLSRVGSRAGSKAGSRSQSKESAKSAGRIGLSNRPTSKNSSKDRSPSKASSKHSVTYARAADGSDSARQKKQMSKPSISNIRGFSKTSNRSDTDGMIALPQSEPSTVVNSRIASKEEPKVEKDVVTTAASTLVPKINLTGVNTSTGATLTAAPAKESGSTSSAKRKKKAKTPGADLDPIVYHDGKIIQSLAHTNIYNDTAVNDAERVTLWKLLMNNRTRSTWKENDIYLQMRKVTCKEFDEEDEEFFESGFHAAVHAALPAGGHNLLSEFDQNGMDGAPDALPSTSKRIVSLDNDHGEFGTHGGSHHGSASAKTYLLTEEAPPAASHRATNTDAAAEAPISSDSLKWIAYYAHKYKKRVHIFNCNLHFFGNTAMSSSSNKSNTALKIQGENQPIICKLCNLPGMVYKCHETRYVDFADNLKIWRRFRDGECCYCGFRAEDAEELGLDSDSDEEEGDSDGVLGNSIGGNGIDMFV